MRLLLVATLALAAVACSAASAPDRLVPKGAIEENGGADETASEDPLPEEPSAPLAESDDPVKEEPTTDEEIESGMTPKVADFPLPAIPASCALKASVVTYTPRGVSKLLDALEAQPTPCADYLMFLPALVADKTKPRAGGSPQSIRAREGRFHAVAEFHWQTWKNVPNMTWYQRGVEFRARMAAAGYNVARGDTWAVNELPSTIRTDPATRAAARALVRGLYDGPAGSPKRAGIVFVIGFAHDTQNVSVLKQTTKSWLEDAPFWQTMDQHVLRWAQEAYAKPSKTCVPNSTTGAHAVSLNDFGMHAGKLAAVGPASVAAARKFFDQAYVSLLTASWKQSLYGQTNIPLEQMKRFVSDEVYAQRAFAASHAYPDGRVGLSWHNTIDNTPDAQIVELAERTAASIRGAYGISGTAAHACSPTGAFTLCNCEVAGASYTQVWNAFESY